jgi:hypothetical protein
MDPILLEIGRSRGPPGDRAHCTAGQGPEQAIAVPEQAKVQQEQIKLEQERETQQAGDYVVATFFQLLVLNLPRCVAISRSVYSKTPSITTGQCGYFYVAIWWGMIQTIIGTKSNDPLRHLPGSFYETSVKSIPSQNQKEHRLSMPCLWPRRHRPSEHP